jgi:hypothetical protein
MLSTEAWARSFAISVEPTPPEIEGYSKPYGRSAELIAVRALILQGVVCAAGGVTPTDRQVVDAIVQWYHDQRIWPCVTPKEKAFLSDPSPQTEQRNRFYWHSEAQWTLLWMVGKVEALGLPIRTCDTQRLCFDIMPPLGSDVIEFVASAELRSPGLLLAEDDRTYDLWCRGFHARRKGEVLPYDLNWGVLYERRYAFEWLDGIEGWDNVTCDA